MFKGRMLRAGGAGRYGRDTQASCAPALLGISISRGQWGESASYFSFSSFNGSTEGAGVGLAVVVLMQSSCRQGLL